MKNVYKALGAELRGLVKQHGFDNERVEVKAKTLTPRQTIGNPEDKDYPILKGRERMIAAYFRSAEGHAFTDMFGNYTGTMDEIVGLRLKNNFHRAIFIATINAVTRYVGITKGTMHCRDNAPKECAARLVGHIRSFGSPKRVALVGLQPRMLEALAGAFEVCVTDIDADNINQIKSGVRIEGTEATGRNIDWCDIALVTGTTVVNGTIERFLNLGKPTVFYGVSISGTAALLNLNRYCPLGN